MPWPYDRQRPRRMVARPLTPLMNSARRRDLPTPSVPRTVTNWQARSPLAALTPGRGGGVAPQRGGERLLGVPSAAPHRRGGARGGGGVARLGAGTPNRPLDRAADDLLENPAIALNHVSHRGEIASHDPPD